MRGSLGEKIGEGAAADVHAWAPGQVLKLFKHSVDRRLARYERRVTHAVFAAGGPAPEVLGDVNLEGRFGIVLPYLDGPTLLHLWQARAMTTEQVGATLATLRTLVQATPPPTEVASLHDWMDTLLRNSADSLPKPIVAGVSRLLDRLPPGDALCHCDLHPGNVIMTAEGPRLIDWMGAKRADAAVDLGCCQVLLCDLFPEILGERKRQRALNAALQSEYARQVGMSSAALTAAIEPYLPIIRVLVLIIVALRPATRERLIHRVEADLREAK